MFKLFENVLVCLERPTEAYVRKEGCLFESILVSEIEGRRYTNTKHEAVGALIAVADVAEEEITEVTIQRLVYLTINSISHLANGL